MSRSFIAANSARPVASSFCSDWMDPRSWTSASASRTLSASASARLSTTAACWFSARSARCRAFSTSRRMRASSFWQTLSSSPRRANSLCTWPWRCMAEIASRSASRCFSLISDNACSVKRNSVAAASSAACFSLISCWNCITSASRARNSRFMPSGPTSSGRPPVTMRPW